MSELRCVACYAKLPATPEVQTYVQHGHLRVVFHPGCRGITVAQYLEPWQVQKLGRLKDAGMDGLPDDLPESGLEREDLL